MPYIGNNVQVQGFTPAIDYFSGDGVTVTFTLSRPVVSVSQTIVAVDNVIQNPSSAYTVSGSSITFTSAPLAGTNNIWVEYTSLITTYAAISQDPSVIGDITASGGFLSTGDFGNSYIDGTIVDYVTGNARITTGPIDDMTFYHGGSFSRSEMLRLSYAGNSYFTGNLGIGTTSPIGALDVRGSVTSRSSSSANTNSAGFFAGGAYTGNRFLLANLDAVSGANNIYYGGGGGAYESATNHYFLTGSAGTLGNGTTKVTIDSTGRMLRPYQTGFQVRLSGSNQAVGSAVIFNSADVNIGSNYNTSNGYFTAPVAGTYLFAWHLSKLNGTSYFLAGKLFKNGSDTGYFSIDQDAISYSETNYTTVILTLAAGDYMYIKSSGNSDVRADYVTSWTGYLMG